MRATTLLVLLRLICAAGVGSVAGAAAAGVLALLTGAVFTPGSTWLTALPVLLVLGAPMGVATAWLTRHWLVPTRPHRLPVGAAAGATLTPLAIAAATPGTAIEVTLLMMLVGSVATAVTWVRWYRARHTPRFRGYRPATRRIAANPARSARDHAPHA